MQRSPKSDHFIFSISIGMASANSKRAWVITIDRIITWCIHNQHGIVAIFNKRSQCSKKLRKILFRQTVESMHRRISVLMQRFGASKRLYYLDVMEIFINFNKILIETKEHDKRQNNNGIVNNTCIFCNKKKSGFVENI